MGSRAAARFLAPRRASIRNLQVLEPFQLAIAGDFVRRSSCPVEAAALSGLEAGARVAMALRRE